MKSNGNNLVVTGNGFYFAYTLDTGTEGISDTFVIEAGCDPGDINDDAVVNVLDVVAIVNLILADG